MNTPQNFALQDYERQVRAGELFQVDLSSSATIKIARVDPRFYEHFGESPIIDRTDSSIGARRLDRFMTNTEVLTLFGGPRFLTLADFWNLLLLQPNGEPGDLLCQAFDNGYANIICAFADDGVVRTVYAMWYFHGWYIGLTIDPIDPISRIRRTWSPGHKVFFRS